MTEETNTNLYTTLRSIEERKMQLRKEIRKDNDKINKLRKDLFAKPTALTSNNFHRLSVVSELDVFGQPTVYLFMQSYIMTGMYEERLSCPYSPRKSNGIVHILMSVVGWMEAQRIDNQRINTL